MSEIDYRGMSDADFRTEFARILEIAHAERRENQLLYYKPVSPTAMAIHVNVDWPWFHHQWFWPQP